MNIERKGVDLDTRCAVCNRLFEDGGHLFLKCKFIKQRWRALLLEDVRLKLLPCRSSLEVLQEVLNLPESEQLITISLLWNCWTERNKGNHGEQRLAVDQFQYNAKRCVDEWIHFVKKKQQQATEHTERKWCPPSVDYVKINTDAAFDIQKKSGGWGAICRDNTNTIQFPFAGSLMNASNALHAEAIALSNAIQAADQMGVGRVIF